jgi:hypothetical protein
MLPEIELQATRFEANLKVYVTGRDRAFSRDEPERNHHDSLPSDARDLNVVIEIQLQETTIRYNIVPEVCATSEAARARRLPPKGPNGNHTEETNFW